MAPGSGANQPGTRPGTRPVAPSRAQPGANSGARPGAGSRPGPPSKFESGAISLSPRQRRAALGGALVLTLALAAWISREEPADEEVPATAVPPAPGTPSRPGGRMGSATPGTAPPGLRSSRPAAPQPLTPPASPEIRDLFAQQTWEPPPPPETPAPPEPPPLPFTYLGRLVDQGRVTLYLAEEDRNLVVRQGDVINGTYRVKRISPSAVTFVYIPMNRQQILDIGRKE